MSELLQPPILAITCGDPAGIGPEVALAATRAHVAGKRRSQPPLLCLLVGPRELWLRTSAALRHEPVFTTPDQLHSGAWQIAIFDTAPTKPAAALPMLGQPTAAGGRIAFQALRVATDLVLGGEVAGMVTAPLSKEFVAKRQPGFVGHTEYLEQRVRELRPQARALMLLEGGGLRVALATTHIPLREVPRAIEKLGAAGLARMCQTLAGALRLQYGISTPRIGVLGLNPHAGEGGLLGDEEKRIITPAIRRAQSPLWQITGPWPGDTAPYQMKQGRFDALVAMHHDQGLAPLKLVGFADGINVTLGLGIVRTSPDHGTAFDIAGKPGTADSRSMQAALSRAAEWVRI